MNVKITKKERNEVERFADARCAENQDLYKRRGGFKRDDIVIGAMAEIAVYKTLRDAGIKVKRPDFKIYGKGEKSFESDLSDGKRHYHVKGQSVASAMRYGHSWLMQRSDPLVKAPKLNHYLVPTAVSLQDNMVMILGFPSFTALHYAHAFSDCSVPMFNRTKTAIYLESLHFLSNKALWCGLKHVKWVK